MPKEKKAEDVVMVGPGADEDIREESEERSEEETTEEREEQEGGGEEEERGESDERVGHEPDEGEEGDRESIRRRRRLEKQRKKENRARDRLELNFLRQRNEQLERRQSELDARVANGEMIAIDNKISELDGQIREAERLKSMAVEKANGEAVTEADRIIRDLTAGRNQLVSVREQRTRAQSAPRQQQADPAIIEAARNWAESKDWYDPNLRNADSRVAKAIEDQIFLEGRLDPRTDEYWNELDRRLRKYMPHRYGNGKNTREEVDDDDDQEEEHEERQERREERRPRGPRITVGGRERPLRKNEVYISEERKQALKDANVWDDPVLREKYLKQYQKYDRENRRR